MPAAPSTAARSIVAPALAANRDWIAASLAAWSPPRRPGLAGVDEIEQAVATARGDGVAWAGASTADRRAILCRVADVMARKERSLPEFVHVHPEENVGAAIALLREYDVSQLPVVKEEPPVMAAEVVGSVVERDLLDALIAGRAKPSDPVGGHMSAPLPTVGLGEPVSQAVLALEKAGAALVHVNGKPTGLLTRQDMLTFLAANS